MAGTVIDSLIVTLGLDGSNYKKGAEDATKTNKQLRDDAGSTAKELESHGKQGSEFFNQIAKGALEFFAVIAAGRGMETLYRQAVTVGAAVGYAAQNIGTSTQKLSAWQHMMQIVGASADGATSSLTGLANQQVLVQSGHALEATSLSILSQRFGISAFNNGDINSPKDPSDILEELAPKLKDMTAQKAQYWGQQIGISPDMVNLLRKLSSADLKADLVKFSTTTPEESAAEQQVETAWAGLEAQIDSISGTLSLKFAPSLVNAINAMTAILSGNFGAAFPKTWFNPNGYIPTQPPSVFPAPTGTGPNGPVAVQKQAHDYFMGQGWNEDQTAGILANIQAESGDDPNALSPPDKKGRRAHGLFQWRGDRWAALEAWAKTNNPTAAQQEEFAQMELTGKMPGAPGAGSALKRSTTSFNAGINFDNTFEINGGTLADQISRGSKAQSIEDYYKNLAAQTATPKASGNNSTKTQHITTGPITVTTPAGMVDQISRGNMAQYHYKNLAAQTATPKASGNNSTKTQHITTGPITVTTPAGASAKTYGKATQAAVRQALVTHANTGLQ